MVDAAVLVEGGDGLGPALLAEAPATRRTGMVVPVMEFTSRTMSPPWLASARSIEAPPISARRTARSAQSSGFSPGAEASPIT